MSNRSCLNNKDEFCYICGKHFGRRRSYLIKESPKLQASFESYFNLKLSHDIDKIWAPSSVCSTCQSILSQWMDGKKKYFSFSTPRVWREPQYHGKGGCYFYFVEVQSGKRKTVYPSLNCSIAPIPRGDSPPPDSKAKRQCSVLDSSASSVSNDSSADFNCQTNEIIKIKLPKFNKIVSDLNLSKTSSLKLLDHFKSNNLVEADVTYRSIRHRNDEMKQFFVEQTDSCYCSDISGLIKLIHNSYERNDWVLFIDGSLKSVKAVLLHIQNEKNPIPIFYGRNLKESYDIVKHIVESIKYNEEKWKICCDFKVD